MNGISRQIEVFIRHESAGGVLLICAGALALVLDNSRLSWLYDGLLDTPLALRIGALALDKPLVLWINDGLMAVFFFLVGLEIKREVLEGELADRQRAALPAVAAVGGMLVPSLIYALINRGDPVALRGWAIPAATDIAFALAILSLLGKRVPIGLKTFMLALAILDDLGSIVIIALFYTTGLSYLSLGLACGLTLALALINRFGIVRLAPYVLIGIAMWVCVLKSGVHATLAGVITALAIPLGKADRRDGPSLLHQTIDALHPWVTFAILPLFAFANAGVSLAEMSLAAVLEPIPLGIALGLLIGKQIGVFAFSALAIGLGLGRMPERATWLQLYGVSVIAGIGLTRFSSSELWPCPAPSTPPRSASGCWPARSPPPRLAMRCFGSPAARGPGPEAGDGVD